MLVHWKIGDAHSFMGIRPDSLRSAMQRMLSSPPGFHVAKLRWISETGDPTERILTYARAENVDLIGFGVRKAGEITTHFPKHGALQGSAGMGLPGADLCILGGSPGQLKVQGLIPRISRVMHTFCCGVLGDVDHKRLDRQLLSSVPIISQNGTRSHGTGLFAETNLSVSNALHHVGEG